MFSRQIDRKAWKESSHTGRSQRWLYRARRLGRTWPDALTASPSLPDLTTRHTARDPNTHEHRISNTVQFLNNSNVIFCLSNNCWFLYKCLVVSAMNMQVLTPLLLAWALCGVRAVIRTPLEAFRPSAELHLRRPEKLSFLPHKRISTPQKGDLKILYQTGVSFIWAFFRQ